MAMGNLAFTLKSQSCNKEACYGTSHRGKSGIVVKLQSEAMLGINAVALIDYDLTTDLQPISRPIYIGSFRPKAPKASYPQQAIYRLVPT